MQKVFFSLRPLDERCVSEYGVPSALLMENAARGLAESLRGFFKTDAHHVRVEIVCGSGDNGADGLALARMIADECSVRVVLAKEPRSPLCVAQKERLEKLGIEVFPNVRGDCDYLIDAFLGSGFSGELKESAQALITKMNAVQCTKIACDIPAGLNSFGQPSPVAFKADMTVSMGALKSAFYSDSAKDFVGEIVVADLGVPRSKYEQAASIFLLEKGDYKPPYRKRYNTHKGTYGHAAIFCGEKEGAAVLAAQAAFSFGAGALTIFGAKPTMLSADLMHAETLPKKATAVCIGPGCGKADVDHCMRSVLEKKLPLVVDAEALSAPAITTLCESEIPLVLTPHPKEFALLLTQCKIASPSVDDIQKDRFAWVQKFCAAYPSVTLILKGANVLIGKNQCVYINPHGTPALAKAGSGDVLAGFITALLAQGYSAYDSAVQASLAHSLAGASLKANYALSPFDIINAVKEH